MRIRLEALLFPALLGAQETPTQRTATAEVGHRGFRLDAMGMAALLHDFVTDAEFRGRVKQEFAGTKLLFSDYVAALRKAYPVPAVP